MPERRSSPRSSRRRRRAARRGRLRWFAGLAAAVGAGGVFGAGDVAPTLGAAAREAAAAGAGRVEAAVASAPAGVGWSARRLADEMPRAVRLSDGENSRSGSGASVAPRGDLLMTAAAAAGGSAGDTGAGAWL